MYGVFGGITTFFHAAVRYPLVAAILAGAGLGVHEFHQEVPKQPAFIIKFVDRVVDLKNVNFDTNSAKLSPLAQNILDSDVEYAKKNPNAKFNVIGHCDIRGSFALNQALSDRRAEVVRKYLVDNGISSDRVIIRGMNFSLPIADNKNLKGLAVNRRTEIMATIKESVKEEVK